jgi:DNA processing protein
VEAIVAAGGAVAAEMPVAWEARGRDFPRRNRIVSGLSYGVIVIEAAHKSGSLITARFALEQGREVFAVPGSPLDPRAHGTNELIRGGATLCASAEHVIEVLAPLIARGAGEGETPSGDYRESVLARYGEIGPLWDELDFVAGQPIAAAPAGELHEPPHQGWKAGSDGEVILALLSTVPISVDELARQALLPVRSVQQVLVELELGGRIERQGSNGVSLRPNLDPAAASLRDSSL